MSEELREKVELLPCPCCGSSPLLVKKEGYGPAGAKYSRGYVRCRKCDLTTPTKSPWETAAKRWNRRTSISEADYLALLSANEGMRKALENLERKASIVASKGAVPGHHFVALNAAILQARAALNSKLAPAGEGEANG